MPILTSFEERRRVAQQRAVARAIRDGQVAPLMSPDQNVIAPVGDASGGLAARVRAGLMRERQRERAQEEHEEREEKRLKRETRIHNKKEVERIKAAHHAITREEANLLLEEVLDLVTEVEDGMVPSRSKEYLIEAREQLFKFRDCWFNRVKNPEVSPGEET